MDTSWKFYINLELQILTISFFFVKETYPQTAPIWFSDSEDSTVVDVVGELANSKQEQFNVSIWIHSILAIFRYQIVVCFKILYLNDKFPHSVLLNEYTSMLIIFIFWRVKELSFLSMQLGATHIWVKSPLVMINDYLAYLSGLNRRQSC